jgi:2,3,4,5-tetrahydropyridine-2,6-dicarboxylate N-succinyltransferase
MESLIKIIENAWADRSLLQQPDTQTAIRSVIELLDTGQLRVASPDGDSWMTHEWIKKAVLLYFPIQPMETLHAGPLEWHDKMRNTHALLC